MKQGDKIAQLCAMYYLDINNAEVEDVPGKDVIRVSGSWTNLNISKADFKEIREAVGMLAEQELSASITDVSQEKEAEIMSALSSYVLIRLSYTNGAEKVVGTDKFPVYLTYEKSGLPATIIVSCKRSSPELSKVLQSF